MQRGAVVIGEPSEFSHCLLKQLAIPSLAITVRNFPDGETYVRFAQELTDQEVILIAHLRYPDPKILPLLFIAQTAKNLGAKRVGLIVPYLPYMRQDSQFYPGEGVTSRYFAELISHYVDWLITVDPHLHRYHSLSEIYTIPTKVVSASARIAEWIQQNIQQPVLIGPDSESKQWVAAIAEQAGAPYTVLEKVRHGDREVEVSIPHLEQWIQHTPVLIDDIIVTGKTMLAAIRQLRAMSTQAPVCIGIHAIFVENAYQAMMATGAQQIITCNTLPHISNRIELGTETALASQDFMDSFLS